MRRLLAGGKGYRGHCAFCGCWDRYRAHSPAEGSGGKRWRYAGDFAAQGDGGGGVEDSPQAIDLIAQEKVSVENGRVRIAQ